MTSCVFLLCCSHLVIWHFFLNHVVVKVENAVCVCVFAYSYLGESEFWTVRLCKNESVYHVFASKEVLFCGEKRVCFTHESAFSACVSESILWAGLNMEIGRSWGIFPR